MRLVIRPYFWFPVMSLLTTLAMEIYEPVSHATRDVYTQIRIYGRNYRDLLEAGTTSLPFGKAFFRKAISLTVHGSGTRKRQSMKAIWKICDFAFLLSVYRRAPGPHRDQSPALEKIRSGWPQTRQFLTPKRPPFIRFRFEFFHWHWKSFRSQQIAAIYESLEGRGRCMSARIACSLLRDTV